MTNVTKVEAAAVPLLTDGEFRDRVLLIFEDHYSVDEDGGLLFDGRVEDFLRSIGAALAAAV